MHKRLIGSIAITALLAGCAQEIPATPTASPQPLTQPMLTVLPAPLNAEISGTTYQEGFARSCNAGIKDVSFSQADITTSHASGGVVEKSVERGRVVFDFSRGATTGSNAPDTIAVTFEGSIAPIAVVVNSRLSASLAGTEGKAIVIPGEAFAPDAEGKLHGIKICYS